MKINWRKIKFCDYWIGRYNHSDNFTIEQVDDGLYRASATPHREPLTDVGLFPSLKIAKTKCGELLAMYPNRFGQIVTICGKQSIVIN